MCTTKSRNVPGDFPSSDLCISLEYGRRGLYLRLFWGGYIIIEAAHFCVFGGSDVSEPWHMHASIAGAVGDAVWGPPPSAHQQGK